MPPLECGQWPRLPNGAEGYSVGLPTRISVVLRWGTSFDSVSATVLSKISVRNGSGLRTVSCHRFEDCFISSPPRPSSSLILNFFLRISIKTNRIGLFILHHFELHSQYRTSSRTQLADSFLHQHFTTKSSANHFLHQQSITKASSNRFRSSTHN